MAAGDITWFNEAKAYMLDGGWEAADDIKVAILDNTTTPTAADTTPGLSDFTQATTQEGPQSIGNWGTLVSQSGGDVTIDSATNPSWAQNAGNDPDAYWALIYNDTQTGDPALAFVDLGGPVDLTAGSLTVTWNASGIATL
jgi:hypothetical protein